jgi:hypothetical protein
MSIYKKIVVCVLFSMLSWGAVAVELPDSLLVQHYGVTSDQMPKPLKFLGAEITTEPSLFSMGKNTPDITLRFIERPRPEVTGNPSIDHLNVRQLNECLRAFGGNPVACGH